MASLHLTIVVLLTWAVPSYSQSDGWSSHTTYSIESATTSSPQTQWWYPTSTTASPYGVWGDEVCSLIPSDERFLTWNSNPWSNYTVMADGSCFKEYDIVQVSVWGRYYYTGFMLQANSLWDNTSYGRFSYNLYSDGLDTWSCGPEGYSNVIFTNTPEFYYNHTFYWHAPKGLQTDIIFNATFINEWSIDGGEYWLNVTSAMLEYHPGCDDNIMVAAGNSPRAGGILAVLIFVMYELM